MNRADDSTFSPDHFKAMSTMSFFALALLATLIPLAHSFPWVPPIFGPDTPEAIFKGRILENGRPVPAHLSLEVLYKVNGEEIPLSLIQTNTISNYDLRVAGILLRDEKITNTAFLRAQALSINGGSKLVQFEMQDGKLIYEQDIELGRRRRPISGY